MNKKKGLLLVNLGTPDSPKPSDVKRYLTEFLTDGRVIDSPWLFRQLLVRGIIIPRRYKDSARNYSRIWTEEGSPLLIYGRKVAEKLQSSLGDSYQVELAMRYQNPSIESALKKLEGVGELIVLALFPQYASATTGSVHQKVMDLLSRWTTIPNVRFINNFATQPQMIEAFCQLGKQFNLKDYDHILFSFHGLPERQIRKADKNNCCLKTANCCKKISENNAHCYSAQCHATAQAIVAGLGLESGGDKYSICYQSRLGRDPWLQPYFSDTLEELIKKGKKRVLVYSPAFVCDCLETIDEIGSEYRHEFLEMGGERLDLVPGLNDHPLWIESLTNIILDRELKTV